MNKQFIYLKTFNRAQAKYKHYGEILINSFNLDWKDTGNEIQDL